MAQQTLDLAVVQITNPTSEDFAWRWNGELYGIKAGETQGFARPVAYHLAKHLSTKMITEAATEKVVKKQLDNPNDQIHVKIAQLNTYDTHERRIALYKILQDGQKVLEVISRYPFKGFIGDMAEYEAFVEKSSKKEATAAKKAEK